MRKYDPTEKFRDGLEFIPTTELRLGRIVSVFPDGFSTMGADGEPIQIAPPRTAQVEWLDNPGGRMYVPFLEDWGTVSVPPIGALVVIGFGIHEKPYILGFLTSTYKTRIEKGEFGKLLPGEEVKYRRGYRVRILSNLDDISNIKPSSSDYEIDMAYGDLSKSVIGENETIKAEAGIMTDYVITSLLTTINSFLDDFTIVAAHKITGFELDDPTKRRIKSDLEMFLKGDGFLKLLELISAFLTVNIANYFTANITIFAKSKKFDPDQNTVNIVTSFFPDLKTAIRTLISSRLDKVFPEIEDFIINDLLFRVDGNTDSISKILEDRIKRFILKKFESYINTKFVDRLKKSVNEQSTKALRFLRRNLIKSMKAKISLPFGLLGVGRKIVDTEQEFEEIIKNIRKELAEGKLIDPEPVLLYNMVLRSKRSDDNFGSIEIKAYSNGSFQVYSSSMSGDKFLLRSSEDGHLELEAPSLTITSDQVKIGSEDAEKFIVLDKDSIIATEFFKKYITSHNHISNGPGNPTNPPAFNGAPVSLFSPDFLTTGKIAEASSSAKKAVAE